MDHHINMPESKADHEELPSDKPSMEVEKWRKVGKNKTENLKSVKRANYNVTSDKLDIQNSESKEINFTTMNGKLNNLNDERACGRESNTISKLHSKNEVKSLNQPVSRQKDTITSIKYTKLTPKKKKYASDIAEKRIKLMRKCYEILVESSKPSHRHIAKLLGEEIELETKQEESAGVDKTAGGTEKNAVEEMKVTPNILVVDNENGSCRGRKSQQSEVRDEVPESSRYIQVLSSSGISASHRTAPHRVIYRKVFTKIPSEELSSPYKEEIPLKDNDGMIAGSSKPVDPIQSVADSLSQVSVSTLSQKQRKGKKRKAWSMFTNYGSWGKNTKRYRDGISPSSLGQTGCQMSAQTLGSTGHLNDTAVSLNKLSGAHRGSHCGKEFGASSTSSPSDAETVAKCLLRTGNFDDSLCYPYPETSENPSSAFLLQGVTVDKAELYENYVYDVHMNTENRGEAGNLPKNGLAASSHSDNSNQEEYDRGLDGKQTYLPQSKKETSVQMSGYNDYECLDISPSKCSSICALKSNDCGKDYHYCKRNLQGIAGQPRNERVTGEDDFTIGSATLDNLDKFEENLSKNSLYINENHVYCTKDKIVHDITVELDSAAVREDKITLESCENECHDRAKIQPADHVSNTSFHTTLSENSVLSSLEELTEAVVTRCDQSPLKTSSPNNTFDSDEEDVLSLYASSWAELDTDIEKENDKNNEQKKSDRYDVTNEISGKENNQMKNIGMCLKLHASKSKCEQEITSKISDENYVAYDMPNEEYCERNMDINDGESQYDASFDKDIWHSFHSRKYSRKDVVSQSTCIETETSNKLDFGDSSCRNASFSEKTCDGVLLLGKSTGKCVQKNISDEKGNGVKADHYSRIAVSSQSRENNIGSSRGATFSGVKKKSESYLSLLNSLQELNLTENVGSQEKEKKIKSGKEVKEKCVCVDEKIYSKKKNKLLEKAFLLPDLEPQRSSYPQTQRREINKSVPKPKFPVTSKYRYCFNFIHRGVCRQPACRYHHKMSLELENYMSLLILHYVTHQQERRAWRLIDSHAANTQHASLLAVSLLIPLARYFVELDKHHELFNVEVPSYLTSALDLAKVRVLCETNRGYDAYKLLRSCILNVTPLYVEVLIGVFIWYCENHPEAMAASPWEKVLLWKYEKPETLSEERMKDILDIGWLKFLMEYKNVRRVCDAYSHLSRAISLPSTVFTYFTCCVINFLIEIGERKTSFCVLKEVQRLKANDADIFIALVPTDKESAMSVLPELAELGQLVCELRVPLPTCTWDLLSTLLMTFGNVTLGIDLLVCAMQINYFEPEVKVLEKLLLECSRGDPALLSPTSNLVCALSAESLTKLRPSLCHLVNQLAHGPLHAQQVKYNIVRHCQAHGINLLSHADCIPQNMCDNIRGNQVLSQFEVRDEENFMAGFKGFLENCVNQTVELSEKRNNGCQYAPSLKERGLPVSCGYHSVDNKKLLLDLSLTYNIKSDFQTKELSGYPFAYIGDNTSLSHFSNSQHNLMENSNVESLSSTYLNKDSRENIVSADFGCQDKRMSSLDFGYQDHVLSLQGHSHQNQTILSGSGSDYENHQISLAASYFQDKSLLPADFDRHYKLYTEEMPLINHGCQYRYSPVNGSCSAELGYQKRLDSGDQCRSYLENGREYRQTGRKGECIEERQECTMPYDSQSSIYSQIPFQTNSSESMLGSSQIHKGLPMQGSVFNDVTSAHLSVSPESVVSVSGYHDDTYEKGNAFGTVFEHDSIPNLPLETRSDLKLLKHTQSRLCSSHKMAQGFDSQEMALYSSTNDIRLKDMNYSTSGVSNGPFKHNKKYIPFYSVRQKQQSCQAYQPNHIVEKDGTPQYEIFCTEAKTDQIGEIVKQTKVHSESQERVNPTRGLKMVKTNRMEESLPKMPLCDGSDKRLSIREGKLSQLTEDTDEHHSHSCFLPKITQGCVIQKKSQNTSKITQSAISPVWESASSPSLEYLTVGVEGCSISPKSFRAVNPEVTLPVSTVSLNKRRTWQHQQNLRNSYQRKVRRPGVRNNDIFGQSGPYKKYELKLRDCAAINIDSRNKTQGHTSRITDKMPQLRGNVADDGSIIISYQDHEKSAAMRSNTTGRHNPADVTVTGTNALRNLNDLLGSDRGTFYLNQVKGTMGSTAGYKGGRKRRRLGLGVTRKVKRKRFKPRKGSKRPLLHHDIF